MATQQTRPFSKDYSGLANQTVLAVGIIAICTASHEYMKRKRRGKRREEPLGSVESWQFGYLYQGRSWAKNPSTPTPRGWPFSWVKEVVAFPESRIHELRGMDATLYNRFLRGCFWFVLLHTFTTSVILLPIHIEFSDDQNALKSMNRALISSLVSTTKGKDLLWIHLVLVYWVTVSWVFTLVWITRGTFRYRAKTIEQLSERSRREVNGKSQARYTPHPHPHHPFHEMPPLEVEDHNRGLKLRTIMVTNVPQRMRSEKELREYFEHYMSKPLAKPSLGLTSGRTPGFMNRTVAYLLNRVRELEYFSHSGSQTRDGEEPGKDINDKAQEGVKPEIQRVLVARRMTELASQLDRREEMLKRLETAHIKLARNVLEVVKKEMDLREFGPSRTARMWDYMPSIRHRKEESDIEKEGLQELSPEARMDLLVTALGPYVEEFEMRKKRSSSASGQLGLFSKLKYSFEDSFPILRPSTDKEKGTAPASEGTITPKPTIWEALFNLPRSALHPYQPLVHLSALFRGKTVPAIDYYTAKVDFLSKLIAENRSKSIEEYEPVSTAFVTFVHPDDARRAVNYLAVHPTNPLICLVTMAPDYEDIDWVRVMMSRFKAELLKDWVVNLGVWVFTIVWIIPVTLLVTLVSISNISHVWPGLQTYLDNHAEAQDLISSLLPTVLTSGLMLLVPVLLLLIAKKAHTINTLSALHDLILTRYHKFLVANILVFFCVGVTALESFFTSFKNSLDILTVVGGAFPSAGPFYVGWIIFTTGLHGGLELALFGLPLIVYPATKRAVTPRRRAVGIRPRTFNYYYWLPNHVLIIIITAVFAVLNPLLTPFVLLYFSIEHVVVRNQLIHVYAKNYEGQGSLMLVRIIRYTLDGFVLAQVVFLGFCAVEKKEIHVGFSAVLIAGTVLTKLLFTRVVRVKLETADIYEAREVCGVKQHSASPSTAPEEPEVVREAESDENGPKFIDEVIDEVKAQTWKLKKNFVFDYSALGQQSRPTAGHKPNPFNDPAANFNRMHSWDGVGVDPLTGDPSRPSPGNVQKSMPDLNEIPKASSPEPMRHNTRMRSDPPLVTPHDKHPAWDDTSRLDRPYDNPYYARPVPNHLWLPRNPVGLLDLDDTVDVHKSLTADPAHEEFGELVEGGIGFPDIPMVFTSTPDDEPEDDYPLPRQLTGDEEIALPPEIARRVENIHQETDVEYADEDQRPSLVGLRKTSGVSMARKASTISANSSRKASLPLAHPTTFDDTMPRSSRMRSGSVVSNMSFARHSALFSKQEPLRRFRSATMLDSITPPAAAGLPSTTRSRLSMASSTVLDVGGRMRQQSSPARGVGSGSDLHIPVSARDAIVNEVIVEEVQVSEEQKKKEETEKEKATVPETRSWLTRWMFSRTKHET